jgi:ubiquinone/menaquinone biosynthesis C-methylase UbiE
MSTNNNNQCDNVKSCDFEHPSFWFAMEDKFKTLFGSYYFGADVKSLRLKGNESLLDFGCGGGAACLYLLKILSKRGHVLGVNTSAYWINVAKKRMRPFPNAEFKVGDIRDLDIPEHSMDIIVSFNVFHHITPNERPMTIIALGRLLEKGGRLMVRERIEKSHGIPTDEIRSLFINAGFQEVTAQNSKSKYRGIFVLNSDSE